MRAERTEASMAHSMVALKDLMSVCSWAALRVATMGVPRAALKAGKSVGARVAWMAVWRVGLLVYEMVGMSASVKAAKLVGAKVVSRVAERVVQRGCG